MKDRDIKLREWKPIHRQFFAILGLMFIGLGAFPLLQGRSHYQNYWGGAVFAPFALFVGLLFLIGVFARRKREK
jgi:hypothetical protein